MIWFSDVEKGLEWMRMVDMWKAVIAGRRTRRPRPVVRGACAAQGYSSACAVIPTYLRPG